MLPDLQPHIEAAQRAARFRRQLDAAAAGRLEPSEARALVVVEQGIDPAPARMRLIAWEDLMADRGCRVDARRQRFEIALNALGRAAWRSPRTPSAAEVEQRLSAIAYMERARDRIDLPAGEVEP